MNPINEALKVINDLTNKLSHVKTMLPIEHPAQSIAAYDVQEICDKLENEASLYDALKASHEELVETLDGISRDMQYTLAQAGGMPLHETNAPKWIGAAIAALLGAKEVAK